MAKRALANPSVAPTHPIKKPKINAEFLPLRIATAKTASAVGRNPPISKLIQAVKEGLEKPTMGGCVAHWMRMGDLRISDNRALARASEQARSEDIPLVVLFILSPQDYVAHDRSPRRIDFVLRNLALIKSSLSALHIPLYTTTHEDRRTVPNHVLALLRELNCNRLFANIEYEVDELRRDIAVCKLAEENGVKPIFVHDRCVVEPGVVLTKQKGHYTVYSPYLRTWSETLDGNMSYYLEDCTSPHPNGKSIHSSDIYGPLFEIPVPGSLNGFEMTAEDQKMAKEVWPAGEDVAAEILERFLHTKSRPSQLGTVSPMELGAESSVKQSRIMKYGEGRDRADLDSTSRISPYLSAGVISARACVRATMHLLKQSRVDASKNSGVGRWVQELAWRDFYTSILAAFPCVNMGRPFNEKYADVVWEDENQGEALLRWQEGRTGVPIVDAAMRCLREMGWVHNRLRMISAMYLCKHLMLDWRLGERFFMQQLIDGDAASNNGGWQWCASTGADACPYFRIFNPYTQSVKADPTGAFIRCYVPELAKLCGSDLHNPSAAVADELGYPRPIIEHNEARKRALRRFKDPGEK